MFEEIQRNITTTTGVSLYLIKFVLHVQINVFLPRNVWGERGNKREGVSGKGRTALMLYINFVMVVNFVSLA